MELPKYTLQYPDPIKIYQLECREHKKTFYSNKGYEIDLCTKPHNRSTWIGNIHLNGYLEIYRAGIVLDNIEITKDLVYHERHTSDTLIELYPQLNRYYELKQLPKKLILTLFHSNSQYSQLHSDIKQIITRMVYSKDLRKFTIYMPTSYFQPFCHIPTNFHDSTMIRNPYQVEYTIELFENNIIIYAKNDTDQGRLHNSYKRDGILYKNCYEYFGSILNQI